MKYLFLFFTSLVASLVSSCNKQDDPLDKFYWGEVTALKNGSAWEGRPRCLIDKPYEQGIDFIFEMFNEQKFHRDNLFFFKIPNNIGNYQLSITEIRDIDSLQGATYHTSIDDGTSGDSYNLLNGIVDNQIIIDRKEGDELWGTFQAAFVKDTTYMPEDPLSPDTVIFTNGRFHTKLLKE